jgi:D-alanyl-D-alanine carboxypeptidase
MRPLVNINQFAGRPDFVGGKTGTTPEAVGNLVSIFKAGGNSIRIIVVLGSEERFKETENLFQKWR